MVRGDNIVLMGEVDEEQAAQKLHKVSPEVLAELIHQKTTDNVETWDFEEA